MRPILKRTFVLILVTLIGFIGIFLFKKISRDKLIFSESNKVYDLNKGCLELFGKEKRLCMKEKIKSNKEFVENTYFYFDSKSNKKYKLRSKLEEDTNFIVIKRESFIRLGGGRCLFTSLFFDFDNEYIYISGDNEKGFFYCKESEGYSAIFPENMNEFNVISELKAINWL